MKESGFGDEEISNLKQQVLDKYAPKAPTLSTVTGTPNLKRVLVDRQSPYWAPVAQIELFSGGKGDHTSSQESEFSFGSKSKAKQSDSMAILNKLVDNIHQVGDIQDIEDFKTLYVKNYDGQSQVWTHENTVLLHESVKYSNLDILKFLIFEQGVSPNLVWSQQWTPLQLAWDLGHPSWVKLLLEHPSTDVDLITDYERGSPTEIWYHNISADTLIRIKQEDISTNEVSDPHFLCLNAIYKHKKIEMDINVLRRLHMTKRSSSFSDLKAPDNQPYRSKAQSFQQISKNQRTYSSFKGARGGNGLNENEKSQNQGEINFLA